MFWMVLCYCLHFELRDFIVVAFDDMDLGISSSRFELLIYIIFGHAGAWLLFWGWGWMVELLGVGFALPGVVLMVGWWCRIVGGLVAWW